MKLPSLLAVALAGASVSLCLRALADVQYTQEMKMGGKTFSKTTNSMRKGAQRMETSYKIGAMEQRSVMLTLCATKQLVTLDPALKIYYITPLMAPSEAATEAKTPAKAVGPKTGAMTTTLVSLKELGPQKVGQFDAQGYEIVTRMQSSGCMGDTDMTIKQQVYVAPGVDISTDGGCNEMTANMSGSGSDGCNASFVRKGNWAAYDKVMHSLPVSTRIFTKPDDATAQSEMATTQVSRAKLPEDLFAIPADYKKVSQADFQKAQTAAMMKSMGGAAQTGAEDE